MNIYLKLSEDIKQDEFIKNIIIARENKNMSVMDAAKYLNISENIILKLEKGNFTEDLVSCRKSLNFMENS